MVRIRSLRHPWTLVFLPVWWAFWTFAGIAVIGSVLRKPSESGPTLVWLALWLIPEVLVAFIWLWTAFGSERVSVGQGGLTIAWHIGRLRLRNRSYPLAACQNLRASGWFGSPFGWAGNMRQWGFGGGTIAFDCSGETVRFGNNLEESEAIAVANDLRGEFPGA